MKKSLLLWSIAAVALTASANEMDFTFNTADVEPYFYGTGKKENYDIAICLDNPALSGAKITALSVVLPGDVNNYSNTSAFLTSELKVERVDGVRVNVPDIASVEATVADGKLTATFAEPYLMDGTPVYIGYSFQLEKLDNDTKYPVAIVEGSNPNGFFFHSSRTQLKWANYVDRAETPMQSAMVITLSGDFPEETAGVGLTPLTVFKTDQENGYSFRVINGGSKEISSVDFTWTMGELSGEGAYTFETPVMAALGAEGTGTLTLPAVSEKGGVDIELTITKINGKENPNNGKTAVAKIIFAPEVPVNRPLVEEYTGLWCGWCVRGYVALEYMKEKVGEDFVAAAWHNGDAMTVTSNYPNTPGGYPDSYINRTYNMDPGSIPNYWSGYAKEMMNLSISCDAAYTDEKKTQLYVKSKFSAIEDLDDANITVGYIVVGDDMKSDNYEQTNYYSGNAQYCAELPGEWGDFFYAAGSSVKGLTFNDVVVVTEYAVGVKDSAPESFKAFETYDHSLTIDVSNLRTTYLRPTEENPDKNVLPVSPDKLRVIAFLLDNRGRVINSVSSAYPEYEPNAGIINAASDNADVINTVFYDLQGNKVTAPAKGIYVRLQQLSDGKTRTSKVVVR